MRRAIVPAGLLCVMLAAASVTAAPKPSPLPTADRRAEIRRRLEFFGLKVVAVDYAARKASTPPLWLVVTAATYQQPSWAKVFDQSLTMWNVMFAVLKREEPATTFATAQDWRTSRLFLLVRLADVVALDQGLAKARKDEEKAKAMSTFQGKVMFRVFDLKTQKLLDTQEFVRKYFTSD